MTVVEVTHRDAMVHSMNCSLVDELGISFERERKPVEIEERKSYALF